MLKEKILHKAGYMAREAVKKAIDEFVVSHPEYESELIQTILQAKKETQIASPAITSPQIEKEVEEGML